jgi:hypothetical protein
MESAAHLQRLVPDAVLVGGAAAILYADHRESRDHDHVVADLADRFEMVLEAVENDENWATNRVTPGKVILGNLDGIEAGVRQMIRKVPLEVTTVTLPSGSEVTVPTEEETLRIKAFLIVRRNQTRDYVDLAALSEHLSIDHAATALARIDDYYADQHGEGDGVASRWSDWRAVTEVLGDVAARMVIP